MEDLSAGRVEETPAYKPYGVFVTSVFTIVFVLLYLLAFVLAILFLMILKRYFPDIAAALPDLSRIETLLDGDFLALETSIYTVLVALLFGFIFILPFPERTPFKDYMALYKPSLKQVLAWLGIMVLLVAFLDSLSYIFELEVIPEWSKDIYRTTDSMAFLVFALAVLAPITEEAVFRGFLFKGVQHRLGPVWAVLLSALPWALLHVFQYDWYHITHIVLLGLVLGGARWKTSSLFVPLILHGLNNTIATLELFFFAS